MVSQHVCSLVSFQLLQSFKIMDYSLLMGIHNVDQACREQASEEAVAGAVDQRRPQKSLYSTAIEAIQADAGSMGSKDTEDKLVTAESTCVKQLRCHSFCCHSEVLTDEDRALKCVSLCVVLQNRRNTSKKLKGREAAFVHWHH